MKNSRSLESLAEEISTLSPSERKELWSLLATLEERADPDSARALRESEEDLKAGRLYSFDEIFG